MDYLIWEANPAGGYCTLEDLRNVDDSYELTRGVSRSDGFPKEACFTMDASHPKEIKLADTIYTLDNLLVISRQLKEFIESKTPSFIEFLPVTLFNHKGRVASKDYFILNPFHLQDCIDKDKSELVWNEIDPELISNCFQLIVIPDRIDTSFLLFRPKYMPTVVMVRRDLAEEIAEKGFTGIDFVELDEFEL
ncbi:MAG: DUF1629 domain-containing protein [bacterium]